VRLPDRGEDDVGQREMSGGTVVMGKIVVASSPFPLVIALPPNHD